MHAVEIYSWPDDIHANHAIVYVFHNNSTYTLYAGANNTFALYTNLSINLDLTLCDADKIIKVHNTYAQTCGFVLCNGISQIHLLHEHGRASIEVADNNKYQPSVITGCSDTYAYMLNRDMQTALEKTMKKVSVKAVVIQPFNKWVHYNATCSVYTL